LALIALAVVALLATAPSIRQPVMAGLDPVIHALQS
jgi:hypothetical protein